MIPHPIRLRHPWDELPAAASGHVRYRRVFKCPTGLDTWERVWLEVDRCVFPGEIFLNVHSLGLLQSGEFFSADVTSLLQPNNELIVEVDRQKTAASPHQAHPASHSAYIVDPNSPLGSPFGDVRLVIRDGHSGDVQAPA
jgi:hypothetical protein